MSKSDRHRPHQAHYYSKKKDEVMTSLWDETWVKSDPAPTWTRDHSVSRAVIHSQKLPAINLTSPKRVSPSAPAGNSQGINLPTVGPYGGSMKFSASGNYSTSRSMKQSVKAHTNVSDWRNDSELRSWAKDVERRKNDAKSKKLRVANKDATWILQRREKQMKEIQKIQKADVRANASMQEQENKARRAAERSKQMQGNANGMNKAPGTAQKQKEAEAEDKHSEEDKHHEALHWQDIPEPVHKDKPPMPVAIWVKPGHFTTKELY